MFFEIEQKDSYTPDEVQGFISKFVQSETDKVRTEYSRRIKELQTKLPAQPTEVEKALAERTAALDKRERELNCKAAGIPAEYAEFFTDKADFGKLSELFKAGGYIPQNHKQGAAISKEDFAKMNYAQQVKLFETNPELFKQFTQSK